MCSSEKPGTEFTGPSGSGPRCVSRAGRPTASAQRPEGHGSPWPKAGAARVAEGRSDAAAGLGDSVGAHAASANLEDRPGGRSRRRARPTRTAQTCGQGRPEPLGGLENVPEAARAAGAQAGKASTPR